MPIRGRLTQFAVIAGIQPQLHPGQRLGGRQRADENVQSVIAAQGEQAEVGNDQPLRRPVFIALGVFLERFSGDDVDAGLRVAQDLADGNGRGDLLIQLAAGQRQRPFPDLLAGAAGDGFEIITIQQIGDAAVFNLLQQIPVVDAKQPHPRRVQIDAGQRQLLTTGFRQHIRCAAKAQGRLAILNLGGELLHIAGLLAIRRGNAGPRLDRVALAVADALNA